MSVKLEKGSAVGTLSLTPLIDVVFLLLIFFLVATKFAEEDRTIDVQLPSASESKPLIEQPDEIFINIDHEGRYFVDGKTLTADEIEAVLRQAAVNNPTGQSVIIRADRRVQFDFVVVVMNLCNRVNITDYRVTTEGAEG